MVVFEVNVYTSSLNRISKKDLIESKLSLGEIIDAYFFQSEIDPESGLMFPKRIGYEPSKIKARKSGLIIDIEDEIRVKASISLFGLESITQLLHEARIIDVDLSKLKGKKVIRFGTYSELYGFVLGK